MPWACPLCPLGSRVRLTLYCLWVRQADGACMHPRASVQSARLSHPGHAATARLEASGNSQKLQAANMGCAQIARLTQPLNTIHMPCLDEDMSEEHQLLPEQTRSRTIRITHSTLGSSPKGEGISGMGPCPTLRRCRPRATSWCWLSRQGA